MSKTNIYSVGKYQNTYKKIWKKKKNLDKNPNIVLFICLTTSTPYSLFNTKIWLICKCLIAIITIFGLVYFLMTYQLNTGNLMLKFYSFVHA